MTCFEIEFVTIVVDGCTLTAPKGHNAFINGVDVKFAEPKKALPKETVTVKLLEGTKVFAKPHLGGQVFTVTLAANTECEIKNNTLLLLAGLGITVSSVDAKVGDANKDNSIFFPENTKFLIENKLKKFSPANFKSFTLVPDQQVIIPSQTFTFVKTGENIFRSKTDEEMTVKVSN